MLRLSPIFQRWGRDAIRLGKKQQTRRIIKPQPPVGSWPIFDALDCYEGEGWAFQHAVQVPGTGILHNVGLVLHNRIFPLPRSGQPPHGKPGDVWGLREPLRRVGGVSARMHYMGAWAHYADDGVHSYRKWKWKRNILSSRYMPTAFARTFRTITDVRIERVQDISEADCKAEGTTDVEHGCLCSADEFVEGVRFCGNCGHRIVDWVGNFREVWDSINLRRGFGWEKNPWTFVYTFRPAEKKDHGRLTWHGTHHHKSKQ